MDVDSSNQLVGLLKMSDLAALGAVSLVGLIPDIEDDVSRKDDDDDDDAEVLINYCYKHRTKLVPDSCASCRAIKKFEESMSVEEGKIDFPSHREILHVR